MGERISGQSFDTTLDGSKLHVKSISVDITDNASAAQTDGVPNGWTKGDKSAEGEVELDSAGLILLSESARRAGSWEDIPLMDFMFYANTGREEMKVEVFGCKLIVTNLLSIDPKGGELLSHKIKYFSTSPDFVKINGVPYISSRTTRNLLG